MIVTKWGLGWQQSGDGGGDDDMDGNDVGEIFRYEDYNGNEDGIRAKTMFQT